MHIDQETRSTRHEAEPRQKQAAPLPRVVIVGAGFGGLPNIFVLGDTATLTQNGKALPGVAQVAIQQGEYAAAVIAARVAGKEHKRPFHYRNKGTLATIGRSYAIADLGLIRLAGFPAWLIWALVHLLFLIGFRNRYVTLFQWAWSYLTFERGACLVSYEDEEVLRSRGNSYGLVTRSSQRSERTEELD